MARTRRKTTRKNSSRYRRKSMRSKRRNTRNRKSSRRKGKESSRRNGHRKKSSRRNSHRKKSSRRKSSRRKSSRRKSSRRKSSRRKSHRRKNSRRKSYRKKKSSHRKKKPTFFKENIFKPSIFKEKSVGFDRDPFKEIRKKVVEYKTNGIVYGTNDIGDLFEHPKYRHYDISEDDIERFAKELVKSGLVYESGNWDSYYSIVRKENLTSYPEYNMKKMAKNATHGIIFRDTEFKIDSNYNYIKP